jgi:TonB family protein
MRPAHTFILAALAALLALAAQAAEIAHPQWAAQPTLNQIAATHPKTIPPGGSADLSCTVFSDGALKECTVRSESPAGAGLGPAAQTLVPLYRLAPNQPGFTGAAPDEGLTVAFKVTWPRPSVIVTPRWISVPSPSDVFAVFPVRAQRNGREGRADLLCTVTATGTLADCTIAREDPTGYGFGAAALSLAGKFRMTPTTVDGAPVAGAKVNVPILFRIG